MYGPIINAAAGLFVVALFSKWIFESTSAQENPGMFLTYAASPVFVYGFSLGYGYTSGEFLLALFLTILGASFFYSFLEDSASDRPTLETRPAGQRSSGRT